MSDKDTGAKVTLAEVLPRIPTVGTRSAEAFRHGSLLVKVYAPRGHDPQTPHKQDEIYIVMTGTGRFVTGADARAFAPGDMLFVAAGVAHRFEDFSDDLVLWVVFWGPEGGEVRS
jgi:mannose-6-phosphate isomerase-like protein (cupin superfamily)